MSVQFREGTATERPARIDANGVLELVSLADGTLPPIAPVTPVRSLAGTGASHLYPSQSGSSDQISLTVWASPDRNDIVTSIEGSNILRIPDGDDITAAILASSTEVVLPQNCQFECSISVLDDTNLAAGPHRLPLVAVNDVTLEEPITLMQGTVTRFDFSTQNGGASWTCRAISHANTGQVGSFRSLVTGFLANTITLDGRLNLMRPNHVGRTTATGNFQFPTDTEYLAAYEGTNIGGVGVEHRVGEAFDFYLATSPAATLDILDASDASISRWSSSTLTQVPPGNIGHIRVSRTSPTQQEWFLLSVNPY